MAEYRRALVGTLGIAVFGAGLSWMLRAAPKHGGWWTGQTASAAIVMGAGFLLALTVILNWPWKWASHPHPLTSHPHPLPTDVSPKALEPSQVGRAQWLLGVEVTNMGDDGDFRAEVRNVSAMAPDLSDGYGGFSPAWALTQGEVRQMFRGDTKTLWLLSWSGEPWQVSFLGPSTDGRTYPPEQPFTPVGSFEFTLVIREVSCQPYLVQIEAFWVPGVNEPRLRLLGPH